MSRHSQLRVGTHMPTANSITDEAHGYYRPPLPIRLQLQIKIGMASVQLLRSDTAIAIGGGKKNSFSDGLPRRMIRFHLR